MAFSNTIVMSRQGKISVSDSGGAGVPLLMLHGTAASKVVFARQFDSALSTRHRLIAIDLPGHGGSEIPRDPEVAYTGPGMATVVFDVLDALEIAKCAVFGWSLGGHIAIEMMRQHTDRLAGVILTGTPPAAHGLLGLLRAFQLRPEMLFSSKPHFTSQQAASFARLCYGDDVTPALLESILSSDGACRPILFRSLAASVGESQKRIVEQSPLPIAMINGRNEPIARLSYLESLHYQRLWGGACHVIDGAGHAPFLQRADRFNQLTGRFLADLQGIGTVAPAAPLRASARA
jgi:pimeloyl-ACP methyl ester carboxylesterase